MATALVVARRRWLLLVGAVALLGLLGGPLLATRVAGEGTRTVAMDVAFGETKNIVAPGNEAGAEKPSRGDLFSGGGTIYEAGKGGAAAIGTFYFFGTGTASPYSDPNASSQLFEVGRFELWDQGSIDFVGTADFKGGPSYFSIVGGTGVFATAHGQCSEVMVGDYGRFTCEIN